MFGTRTKLPALAPALLAAGLLAEQPADAQQARTAGPNDLLSRVIAAVQLDLNSDATEDRALLVMGEEDADLWVFLGRRGADGLTFAPPIVKTGMAWHGGMWGQGATLETNARGSLLVKTQNDSIGRNRWSQTVTIAFRNGELIVAGLTHQSRDTLDPAAGGNCDVNYLTGRAMRNGKPFAGRVEPVTLAAFDQRALPAACRF